MNMTKVKWLLLAVLAWLTVAQAAAAAEPKLQLVINGQQIAGQVHIHEGRMYAPAEAFAAAIGARVSRDEKTGVYSIQTGKGIPTVPELTRINPRLALYQALSPFIPNMGIHLGVPGPSVMLSVSNEGTINAMEILAPADQGWYPWFDQPEGQPMEMEGLGPVYTQHIYLTNPQGLDPVAAGVPVILDGRYLSVPGPTRPHLDDGILFIPVRAAVELLGGTISWDETARTATATVDPGGISFPWLKQLNPRIAGYQALSPFVPNMGFHYGVGGPHLMVLVDGRGDVVGFEIAVPAVAGWQPWFDQPENQPSEIPGLGLVYNQHVYLVPPDAITPPENFADQADAHTGK